MPKKEPTKKPEDYTFAEIRAILVESDRLINNLSQEAKRRDLEWNKRWEKTEKQWEKAEKHIQEFGGFITNYGDSVEYFFYDYFDECKQIGGITFERVRAKMKGERGEYDIVLSNGKYVGIIEVKSKFHPRDLDKFVYETLPNFKSDFPKYQHSKIVSGIGTFDLVDDVKRLAFESGLYVFSQRGENVKIHNPRSFKCRYY